MPGYRGHLMGGVGAYALMMLLMSSYAHIHIKPLYALTWFACTLAGALFPDIDIKSKGQHYFYWCLMMLLLFLLSTGRLELIVLLAIPAFIPLLVKHRGIFHRWWFIACIAMVAASLGCGYAPRCHTFIWISALFFMSGALSHLMLDRGLRMRFRR